MPHLIRQRRLQIKIYLYNLFFLSTLQLYCKPMSLRQNGAWIKCEVVWKRKYKSGPEGFFMQAVSGILPNLPNLHIWGKTVTHDCQGIWRSLKVLNSIKIVTWGSKVNLQRPWICSLACCRQLTLVIVFKNVVRVVRRWYASINYIRKSNTQQGF